MNSVQKNYVVKAGVVALIVAVVAFLAWAFWGTVAGVVRATVASASLKLLVLAVVLAVVAVAVAAVNDRPYSNFYRLSDEEKDRFDEEEHRFFRLRRVVIGCAIAAGVAVLASIVIAPFTGYYRATVLNQDSSVTVDASSQYAWRTPWSVASEAASSRAGDVVGDFQSADTTFLPATGDYVTPVAARGFAAGLGAVVVQRADGSYDSCAFNGNVPLAGGWFAANLKRALAFVDPMFEGRAEDAWVYCDGSTAKLVVPVVTYAGALEGTPVPGGVVVFDGASAQVFSSVARGQFPGPVYPSSLAADQREALSASGSVWDKVFSRAGFETSAASSSDPNAANAREFLLARADGSGYDYVTPVTPRGKSFSVTAVVSVPADTVTAGVLNPLTVHTLPAAREGNEALYDAVRAAFPMSAWNTGLTMTEVVPLTAGKWEASLVNGRVVSYRVTIADDGSMCLLTAQGVQVRCAGSAPAPSDGDSPGPVSDLSQLSDEELARLGVDVANEQLRRADQ